MNVLTGPWPKWESPERATSVTIGVLDGVHVGHRALIRSLRQDGLTTVLTFDPHPVEVLKPGTAPRLITTIDERITLFADAGVELVGVLDLSEIRNLSPDAFVERVVVDKLAASSLTVGSDFRFGRDRSGDVGQLRALGLEHGYEVDAIELVADQGEAVSSSRIRALLESGDVAGAAQLLGSRFRLTNEVIHGDKRGANLGFPTANLEPPDRKVIPAAGVYAAIGRLAEGSFMAAVNVGVRPTFGGSELLVEAFLLEFDREIYGEQLTLEFVSRLRPELEFDSVGALVDRIRQDVVESRSILQSIEPFVG